MERATADTPDPTPADRVQSDPRRAIVNSLRRYGTESTRLGQAFAGLHNLQPVDIRALVAILDAENAGTPLTPGQLGRHLGMSSAGSSYVIDRLEAAGHVGRHRDDERDNRVVHLRHTPEGLDTGEQFFGPLGRATEALMAQFSLAEIVTVARFMDGAVAVLAEYVQAVGETPRPAVTPSSNSKTPPS